MNLFNKDHTVSVSPSIVVFTAAFFGGLYFLFYIRSIVIMLFAALIVMAAINPTVNFLEKRFKFPRVLGIVTMYFLWIGFLAVSLSIILPPLTFQLGNLIKFLDQSFDINSAFNNIDFSLSALNNVASQLQGSFSAAFSIISMTFSGIFTFFTVTVMSFYMLLDRNNLHKKIAWFTTKKKHLKLAEEFVDSVEHQLGGWIRGQIVLMIVIGVVTYIGLRLLGIPYALPLALLAGLLEILPNLGPTIAAVPAIALAAVTADNPALMAGITTLFYVVMQQLENNIIVPKIMKESVDVSPLTTIVTILIGLQVGGVIGALLSVPVYIIVRSAYSLWRREAH